MCKCECEGPNIGEYVMSECLTEGLWEEVGSNLGGLRQTNVCMCDCESKQEVMLEGA